MSEFQEYLNTIDSAISVSCNKLDEAFINVRNMYFQLKKENEKLKAENEELKYKNKTLWAELQKVTELAQNIADEFEKENQQLKAQLSPTVCSKCLKPECSCHAQLQNCDKASRVEGKAHKCFCNNGKIYLRGLYSGGISTILTNSLPKDEKEECYIDCPYCKQQKIPGRLHEQDEKAPNCLNGNEWPTIQPDPSLRAGLSNLLGCDNENKAVYHVVSRLKDENERLNHTVNDLIEVLKLRENQLAKVNHNSLKLHSHLLRYSACKDILKGFDAFYRDSFCKQNKLTEEQKVNVENLAQIVIKITPVIESFEVNLEVKQDCDICKNTRMLKIPSLTCSFGYPCNCIFKHT